MNSRHLWLLLGPFILWNVLLAAPHKKTSGMPPFPHGNEFKMQQQNTVKSRDGEAEDHLEEQEGKMAAKETICLEEASVAKDRDGLLSKRTGLLPTEKPLCNAKALRPKGGPSDRMPSVPLGQPRPLETVLTGAEGNSLSGKKLQLGAIPGEKPPLSREPTSPESPDLASKPVLSKVRCFAKKNATSGDKTASDGKPVSNSQHGKPMLDLTGKPVPTAGNATHGKLVPSAKPICDGKLGPASGNSTHVASKPGGKPASNTSQVNHGKPTSGGQPSTSKPGQGSHGKPSADGKPAGHAKPESGKKPKPEAESEKEDGKDGKDDAEDLFDDDDDDDDSGKGGHGYPGKGSDDEDEDAFDKELDHGLNTSPFNPEDYRDGWSEEDSEEGEAGPPEDSFDYNEGEPAFDVWGDVVRGPRPDPLERRLTGKTGLFWDAKED